MHRFQVERQIVVGFYAILEDVINNSSIDILAPKSAFAFEQMQLFADEQDYQFEILASISVKKSPFIISREQPLEKVGKSLDRC